MRSRTAPRSDEDGCPATSCRAASSISASTGSGVSFRIDISQGRQLLSNFLPRLGDAPLYGSDRHTKHPGDLVVVIVAALRQQQRVAQLRRQRLNRAPRVCLQLRTLHLGVLAIRPLHRLHHLVDRGRPAPPVRQPAPSRDRTVPRNPQHPRAERAVAAELSQRPPGADERILRHFLRIFPNPQRSERGTENRGLVTGDELVKGVRVALPSQQDQLLVRHTFYGPPTRRDGWVSGGWGG